MCGLFGWIRAANSPLSEEATRHLTAALAILNEQRGRDSVGLASYRIGEAQPVVVRSILPASMFVCEHADMLAAACRPGPGWLLGHTRARTQGPADEANAHPFTFGPVIGAHNGVLWNDHTLRGKIDKAFDVPACDSAVLFALGATIGMKAAIHELKGGMNLTWTDGPSYEAVKLFMDEFRGINLAYVTRWKLALWSSDDAHIKAACAMLGVRVAYDPDGKTPGYYMDAKQDAILTLRPRDVADGCTWGEEHTTTGGRGYAGNEHRAGATWNYQTRRWDYPDAKPDAEAQALLEDCSGPETIYTPRRGYHPSRHSTGVYHKGKRRACGVCQQTRGTPQPPASGHDDGGITAPEVAPDDGELFNVVLRGPKQASRIISSEWPMLECPNCALSDKLYDEADDKMGCAACGIEAQLMDTEGWPTDGGY